MTKNVAKTAKIREQMNKRLSLGADGSPWYTISRKGLRLDELGYKDIVHGIDENFLQQKVRAAALEGVRLAGINDSQKAMTFFIKSAEYNKNSTTYANTVRFKAWDSVVDDTELKPIERSRLLMFQDDIEVNCTCPSFLYWGYRYILSQMDASIFPENRPPVKRNPQMRGIVCKHLNRTMKAFPFYSGDLARHIKEKHPVSDGKSRAWDIKSKTADVLRKNPTIDVDYEDIT